MADDPVATDAQLVEAARLGDSAAFDALVRRYIRPAYALALSMTRDQVDAEDVCQDVFVRVIERLDECRTPDRFAGWFFAIVRRTTQNFRRREHVRRAAPLEPTTAESVEDPARDSERAELRSRMGLALTELGKTECDVVLLHDLEGWTHRTIGDALGITEVSSRQHLFVARRKLRASLGDLQHASDGA
jgi:RNA polymerase sigma-70 factor (ECF subfamily)